MTGDGPDEQFVGIDRNVGGTWTFLVRSGVERLGESPTEFGEISRGVFGACERLLRPVEIEYSVKEYADDGPISAAVTPDPDTDPAFVGSERRTVTDETGLSGLPSLDDPTPGTCIGDLDVVRAEVRVDLADFEGWLGRTDRKYVKRVQDGAVLDCEADCDPLGLTVTHLAAPQHPDTTSVYSVSISAYTGLWFADTEIGHRNRRRLADCFARLRDELPVIEVRTSAETHVEATMRSFLPG